MGLKKFIFIINVTLKQGETMVLIKLFKKYPAYAYLQIASIITGLSSWAGFSSNVSPT